MGWCFPICGGVFADHLRPGRRIIHFLCFAVAVLSSVCSGRAQAFRFFEASNLRIPICADGAAAPVGIVRIERVFTEKRRMGFFRVKLLPITVVTGTRIDLAESKPNTNWLSGFRLPRGLVASRGGVEWREVGVQLPGDSTPRLRIKRLRPPPTDAAAAEYLLLENVTLQTEAGPVQVPQARLLLRGSPGRIVWQSGDQAGEWDLFTGKLNGNKNQNPEIP